MEASGLDPNLLLAQMGKDGNGDDKTLWLFLLLLLYGKDGFGGRGEGVRDAASLADLNALQNSLQNCMVANTNAISERTLDITRDQASNALRNETGQSQILASVAATNSANISGQKDLSAAIAKCCCDNLLSQKDTQRIISDTSCETQRAIERCCCDTQNAIAMQTHAITTAICNDGQLTRALITDNRMQDLQTQLSDCKTANSNLQQTVQLTEQIRNACCQPCQPCHPWGMAHPPVNGNGNGNGGPPV